MRCRSRGFLANPGRGSDVVHPWLRTWIETGAIPVWELRALSAALTHGGTTRGLFMGPKRRKR